MGIGAGGGIMVVDIGEGLEDYNSGDCSWKYKD